MEDNVEDLDFYDWLSQQEDGVGKAQYPLPLTTKKESWTVEKEQKEPEYHACPYIGGTIWLSPLTHAKVTALMDKFNKEWLAYMIGRWDGADVIIDDLAIPEQVSGPASVSEVVDAPPDGKVGVMHSHVKMGAFFSGTDESFINSNHDVSVVVSRKSTELEFKSNVKKRVECGLLMVIDMPVRISVVPIAVREWVDECVVKVKDYVPPKAAIMTGRQDSDRKIVVERTATAPYAGITKEAIKCMELEVMLEKMDEQDLGTAGLYAAYNKAFPASLKLTNAVQAADNAILMKAILYMERYGFTKGNPKYVAAWNEMVYRVNHPAVLAAQSPSNEKTTTSQAVAALQSLKDAVQERMFKKPADKG